MKWTSVNLPTRLRMRVLTTYYISECVPSPSRPQPKHGDSHCPESSASVLLLDMWIYPHVTYCLFCFGGCFMKSILLCVNIYDLISLLIISKITSMLLLCIIHAFSLLYESHRENHSTYLSIPRTSWAVHKSFKNIKVGIMFWIICIFHCFGTDILSTIPDGITETSFLQKTTNLQEIQIMHTLSTLHWITALPVVPWRKNDVFPFRKMVTAVQNKTKRDQKCKKEMQFQIEWSR